MVAAGGIHSLGIRSDGSLWAWGANAYGALGLGDNQNRIEPTLVRLPITMPWIPLLLLD
jgi:alpha-tubulin suppressor-like RCC1 family protein